MITFSHVNPVFYFLLQYNFISNTYQYVRITLNCICIRTISHSMALYCTVPAAYSSVSSRAAAARSKDPRSQAPTNFKTPPQLTPFTRTTLCTTPLPQFYLRTA